MDESLTVRVDIGLVAEMIARDLSQHYDLSALLRVAEAAAELCSKLQTCLVHGSPDDRRLMIDRADAHELGPMIEGLDAKIRALTPNTKPQPATQPCDQANIGGVRSTAGVRIAVDPYADLGTRGLR